MPKKNSPVALATLTALVAAAAAAPAPAGAPSASAPPRWDRMPMLSPEAARAGISPGGEGCQWPRSAPVIAAADPDFLLLPIDVGGLYRSLDGGRTWNQASVGWHARGANCLAVDPKNPDRVIGVAGNSLDWQEAWGPSPNGVYLSTDKAASWRHVLALRDGRPQNAAAFDPTSFDPAKGYCTVAYVSSNRAGLLRTEDGGATWKRVSGQPAGMNHGEDSPPHLLVDPRTGHVWLGGKGGLFESADGGRTFARRHPADVRGLAHSPAAPGALWVSGPEGILLSTDGGKSFAPLPAAGLDRQNGKPVRDVSVSPANPAYLSAWVQGDDWKWVRYASRDGGKSFAEVKIEKGFAPMPYNVRQGWYAWHPKDANVVFGLGGDWVTRSDDGGKTFRWANNGYNGVMLGGHLSFSAHAPDAAFLAFQDYNGAVTTDGGKTWTYRDVSGKGWGGYCYGGHTPDGRTLFCGDADSWGAARRLRLSRDGGKTWAFVPGADGKPLEWKGTPDASYSDPNDARVLFAGPYRSADGGATWAKMTGCDAVLTHDPRTKALFGRRGGAVVRSRNRGADWETVAGAAAQGGIDDVAVDHVTGRVYAAAQEKLKVYENGAWATVETPKDQYGAARVVTVAVDPQDPRVLYVGGPKNVYASHATVCRSTDGGKTWRNLTVTTPLAPGDVGGPHEVASIRVHPVTREAWVAGQCYGMWRIGPPAPGEAGLSVAQASAPAAPRPPAAGDAPKPASVVASAAAIALRNGGMEQASGDIPAGWDSRWVGEGRLKVSRDTAVKRAGEASLRVESEGDGPAKGQAAQLVDAPAGSVFTLRGWVRSEGRAKVNVAVQSYDAAGKPISFQQVRYAQNDTDWTGFAKTITLPPGTARFGVVLLLDGAGKAWMDEVKVDGVDAASATTDPATLPPGKATPTEPVHGYFADYPNGWLGLHKGFVAEAKKGTAKVVFLGDSITQGWGGAGKDEWQKRFAPLGAVNFGIGGDRTQQILWRIEHGTLDGLDPELIVLKIGVNNLWSDVNEYGRDAVADGIAKVVAALRAKAPKAKILVLGILPAMEKGDNPIRAHAKAINARTATLDDGKTVRYRDISAAFLEPDGSLSKEVAPDFVHLSPEGYRRFADAIEPTVKEMLR